MAKELKFKQGSYKEAVEYFKKKINLPTKRWNDLEGAMHTRAFTVAGAMRADILLDFRKAVDAAIEKGESLQDFRDRFYNIASKWRESDPSFDEKMQKPKYGAWRSKVIYQTNILTSAAAAQERQARAMPDVFTHAKYVCMMMPTSREQHKAWNGTVLPVNDPWWEKHSPPNGFGCLCEKEFISKYEMDSGIEKVTKAPTAPNDTTNIGEKWDYSIGDADAENQRLMDQMEDKEEKLFKKYPEAKKNAFGKSNDFKIAEAKGKQDALKNENSKQQIIHNQIEKRQNILNTANERHLKRTEKKSNDVREKWRIHQLRQDLNKKGYSKEYIQNILDIEKNIDVKYIGEMQHDQADAGHVNPNFASGAKYKTNCQSCAVVYELRRRGFNVTALPRGTNVQNIIGQNAAEAWINPKTGSIATYIEGGKDCYKYKKSHYTAEVRLKEIEQKMKEDGRYSLSLVWEKAENEDIYSSHIINAERENGILKFYDGQNDKYMNLTEFKQKYISKLSTSFSLGVLKTSDLLLNTKLDFKSVLKASDI